MDNNFHGLSNEDFFKSQSSWYREIIDFFKEKIFLVIHVTLKYDSISFFTICIMCFVELMQLMTYPFHEIFNDAWFIKSYSGIYEYFSKFFQIFKFIPYLKDKSFSLYLAIFYIIIFLLLVITVLFIYLSITLKKNKLVFLWPIHIFKIFATLFNSILLIPFLEIFFSILNCNKLQKTFPEIACYKGEYIAHTLFACLGTLIVLFFSYVFATFFFDIKTLTNNYKNRQNTSFDVSLLVVKIVIVLFFEFLNGVLDSQNVILSLVLLISSTLLFFKIWIEKPYYFLSTQKIFLLTNSLFFWTNINLFFEKIFKVFQYDGFDGNLEIWILGIVLIAIYDIFYKDDYTKLLMINTYKIMRAEEALRKIKFFLELIDKRNTKKSYRILLKGYVFHHEENCEYKDCSLKAYKKKMIENPDTLYEDESKLLLSHCNRLYEISLSKFPKHTQLRIFYAVFLLERMKNINLAKMQLSFALYGSTTSAEQFSIFRFNKIITEEFFNFDDENLNLDIASTIAFDQYMKKFKEEIEKIGFSYIDFWNSFVQDDINIGKIRSLGFKINELIKSVFQTWNCMQALNPNDKESLRLYGQFLIDILNEKSNGQQFIDKSKEAINNYNNIKFFKNDIFSLSSDGSPCLLASPVENKGAIITQLTLSASRIFGYDKLELIGKNVNVLLPSIFRDDHTEVINHFMKEKSDSKLSESKRINGLALAKTGFLFPVSMTLNYLPSLTGEATLAVIVKKEKQISYTAHVITNKELDILYISSECLKLFNMKEKAIWSIKNYLNIKKDERLNLKYFLKELNEDGKFITDYDQEKNYPINVRECESSSKAIKRKSTLYNKDIKSNYMTNLNSVTMNYRELMMGPKSLDTYIVRFEVSLKSNLLTISDIKFQEKLVFHYDEENINICIRNKNKLKNEKNIKNVFGEAELYNLSNRNNRKNKTKKKEKEEKKNEGNKEGDLYDTLGITNYELNVILFKMEIIPQTRDLVLKKLPVKESRRLGELVEIIETDTLITDDTNLNDYDNENDENDEDEDKTKIELKKSEILSRQHSTTSKSVIRLQWASFLIVAVHVVLAIINFVIYKNFINDSDDFINGINYLSTQLNYTISSVDTLANILILNHPNFTSVSDKLGLVSYYNLILQNNAKMLYDINNEMNSLALFSVQNVSNYMDITVKFSYIESTNVYGQVELNFFEGLLELMSTIFSITVSYSTQMSFTDRDIYYFIYNALNSYYMKSIEYINSYMTIFLNLEISRTGLIIILITIVVYFILMIFLFSVLKFSLSMMNGILLEFLQISPNQAQIIVRKCENFVKNVRINNMDEDEEDKEEEIDLKDVKRNKSALKDKLSKSSTGYNYIIVIMVFVYIIIELYFDIIYIVVNNHQNNLAQYFSIFNSTHYNNINQKLCSSAVKVMAFNPDFYIMNKPSKISTNEVFQTLVSSKQNLDMQFQSQQFFSSSFIDNYNTNLMVVPLNYSNISLLKINNEDYSFNLIYTNYEILLNLLYDKMVKPFNITDVINNDYLTQANFINENVLTNFMFQLSTNLFNDINDQNNFIWNFTVIWFVIYTTLIILIYFLIWRPIEYKLAKDYTRTKLVVLLIPTKIIMKNNKIKDFLIKENLVSIKK